MTKKFSFLYPVTCRQPDTHREGGIAYHHLADIEISGRAFLKTESESGTPKMYSYSIERMMYAGQDIATLTGAFATRDEIEAACLNHLENAFTNEIITEQPILSVGKERGKLIALHQPLAHTSS